MEDWQVRMEHKIDRLSEAVVQLARMEERMVTLLLRLYLVSFGSLEVNKCGHLKTVLN